MKLTILAGGKGTRLGLADKPKPMVKLADKPILQHQIELARRYGIREIILLCGYLSDVIEDYFGDGSRFGVDIAYYREKEPLGTAGGYAEIRDLLGDDRFMVFYGDVAMDFHLPLFIARDKEHPESLGTLLVHPNNHPYDSDLLDVNAAGLVSAFYPKPRPEGEEHRNLVNAAVYILSPKIIDYIAPGVSSDWGKDVFPRVLSDQGELYAYSTPEYIKDMGTKDRLAAIENDWLSGKASRMNLRNKRKAFFLDRDGVINRDVNNLRRLEDLQLLDGVGDAIKMINRSEYLCIVVTNQPVIAKGWLDEKGLRSIHNKMETMLGSERAYVDAIYYCPHHPDKGFEGEVPELKIACNCRKPMPGMLLQAAEEFNIDLAGSIMIGDSERDIQAGEAVGVERTILLPSNTDGSLLQAVRSTLESV